MRRQITLQLDAAAVPTAEALLALAGAESIALADAGDDPVLEPAPETAPLWPHVTLRAVFHADVELGGVGELLRSSCAARNVRIAGLHDADWQGAIRQAFKARPFGRRIWLAPADDTQVPEGRTGIRLHMGLAFGTGEHPTTALCLEWLDANVRAGATIVDYGCGSGVLAIAAIALGASHAWATDNDPQALEATRANAELNGVADRLVVLAPEAMPPVATDIVAANILAGPLIALAPRLAAHARPGGALVLSGLLTTQADAVKRAYEPYCTDFAQATEQGWVCLAAIRRSAG
ncbi:MAG TPA: 50S ribosomal protein L11 methyltransferase [Gammaproteobacteria bacterium]|nr:50S ribosomal protein L11 methyltransferase [Gammaproteobacteria bacterium]